MSSPGSIELKELCLGLIKGAIRDYLQVGSLPNVIKLRKNAEYWIFDDDNLSNKKNYIPFECACFLAELDFSKMREGIRNLKNKNKKIYKWALESLNNNE